MSQSKALPIVWIGLRLMVAVNVVLGVALLALLYVSFNYEAWMWQALGVTSIAARDCGAAGMRAIIAVGIGSVPLTTLVLLELQRIVETVRARDPFTRHNAGRIRTIAWCLLALQILHVAVAAIASAISTDDVPLELGGGGSVGGWFSVLLLFVLAGVFREGAGMRADLEGTV